MTLKNIPFNKPMFVGTEGEYIQKSIDGNRKFSGNGEFTKKCQSFLEEKYQIKKTLLTTSCTTALEMSSLLCGVKEGDEVIIPSYTFVSTANAFLLRGATIRFVDSQDGNPNMCIEDVARVLSPKTKAIVPVHYAGVACDMDPLIEMANSVGANVVEDAAQAVGCFYKGKALGSVGDLGTYSYHETKNINCGEGGTLCINNPDYIERAEIIWEKGTNRASFFRGEIDKYNWVDLGSSCLPSELNAAFLYPQLLKVDEINEKRVSLWKRYHDALVDMEKKGFFKRPSYGSDVVHNGHLYFIVCRDTEERGELINFLKERGIYSFFHYQALHKSPYFEKLSNEKRELPYVDQFTNCLLRLPMFYDLTFQEVDRVVEGIEAFFKRG